MTLDDILKGIENGDIKDSKTITAVLYHVIFVEKSRVKR